MSIPMGMFHGPASTIESFIISLRIRQTSTDQPIPLQSCMSCSSSETHLPLGTSFVFGDVLRRSFLFRRFEIRIAPPHMLWHNVLQYGVLVFSTTIAVPSPTQRGQVRMDVGRVVSPPTSSFTYRFSGRERQRRVYLIGVTCRT